MHRTILHHTDVECLVFGVCVCFFFDSADGTAFCHPHDGPIAAGDGGVYCSLSCFYVLFAIYMYTNFPVLLLFQIKIRITPVVRALHTQNNTKKKQYQEQQCSR